MSVIAEFTVGPDCIEFRTVTNGDRINIKKVHLDADNAAALARLITDGDMLHVEIKVAE